MAQNRQINHLVKWQDNVYSFPTHESLSRMAKEFSSTGTDALALLC